MERLEEESASELVAPEEVWSPEVVERLRIEAVLVQRSKTLQVEGNVIRVTHPGIVTEVTVRQSIGMSAVELLSRLGKVLLVEEAQRLLASGALPKGEHWLQISRTGEVQLQWCQTYIENLAKVDATEVADALEEHVHVAMEIKRLLDEECYLKGEGLPEFMTTAGGRRG